MAGKGRGVLLNDLVKEGKIVNQIFSASLNQAEQGEEAENVTLSQKQPTVTLFGKGLATNPSPSVGRGLMKPMQFMKTSPSSKEKTPALICAEEYLKATVFKSGNYPIFALMRTDQLFCHFLNVLNSQRSCSQTLRR